VWAMNQFFLHEELVPRFYNLEMRAVPAHGKAAGSSNAGYWTRYFDANKRDKVRSPWSHGAQRRSNGQWRWGAAQSLTRCLALLCCVGSTATRCSCHERSTRRPCANCSLRCVTTAPTCRPPDLLPQRRRLMKHMVRLLV
jgi:hypothetical protein